MTENKGDLISRKALRKEVAEKVNFTTVDGHIVYDNVLELIDNAPTVEPERPQGDFISREWLKDAFDNLCCHNCKMCRNFRNEDSFYKCNLIENAPTVETDIEVVAKDAYEHGYTDGWKERFGEPDGRPKGEWVEDDRDRSVKIAHCSICKRTVTANLVGVFSDEYPFCHCGADMRGANNG